MLNNSTWTNAMYANRADGLYVYLFLPYIYILLLFHWLSIVYCLTSPLQIGDTYALCFPSAHELHSVHTMFLFGCFINFVPYTHTYEHIEHWLPINYLHLNYIPETLNYHRWFCPRHIRHPSHLFLCHTCITTVRSLHLQLANKPCPDQRFCTWRSGPPSIAHIQERPTDGIMLSGGNLLQDTRAHWEGENGPTHHLVIRLHKCQDLTHLWRKNTWKQISRTSSEI
jgi:hypothetical protein